jgi:GNAT superfamily N-acetyltransferase
MTLEIQSQLKLYAYNELDVNECEQALKRLKPQDKKIEDYSSLLFAKINDQCVGFLSRDKHFRPSLNIKYDYLEHINVTPSHRRKGIGTLLMIESMRQAKTKGKDFFCVDIKRKIDLEDWYPEALLTPVEKDFLEFEQQENESNLLFFEKIASQYEIKIEKTFYSFGRHEMIEIKYHLETLQTKV